MERTTHDDSVNRIKLASHDSWNGKLERGAKFVGLPFIFEVEARPNEKELSGPTCSRQLNEVLKDK